MKSSLPPVWRRFSEDHQKIESEVSAQSNSYRGLSPEALYTSDEDFLTIFHSKHVTGTFCDLGCGTGRSALLYGLLFPERKSVGIEFEKARLDVGASFRDENAISNVELLLADLLKAKLPVCDTYFFYFPTGHVLDRILTELSQMDHSFHVVVIESHGDLLPRVERENWLDCIEEVPLKSVRHYPFAKIYKKTNAKRDEKLLPLTLSYQNKYLFIGDEEWIGETHEMEWVEEERFELKYPPRTISWKEVRRIAEQEELSELFNFAVSLRRSGSLTIKNETSTREGAVRKIITKPTFALELSSGEKVEWKEILTIHRGTFLCFDSSRPFSYSLPAQWEL